MLKHLKISGLLALSVLLWGAGCERTSGPPVGAETDDANYRRGQQLVKQGRKQEALAAYLKVIAQRGDAAAESHLDAGLIYMNDIKDHIAAIYHFRKFLELQPNAVQAQNVRGLVDSAKREFARTLPGNPLENQALRLDLMDQVDRLQREVDQLKAELISARNGAPAPLNRLLVPTDAATPVIVPPTNPIVVRDSESEDSPITFAPLPARSAASEVAPAAIQPQAAPVQKNVRRHTVAKGDTLFSLAQRYYSNRSKWRDIFEANRDQLPNENALRLGMELKIP
ncbi:MAG: LysM peptidoglycan-binding domain-containing protein [Opitutaceae bacterium]|nr:LysM peptidoglycan-binding domain-containing protein [Opitutaceae bacterium]MBP9913065.1 LysM peptidoglycan-binding domain-containing protein [Opitutaceae bacterium]